MRGAQRPDYRLLAEVSEALFEIRVDRQRQAGFRDLRNLTALQRFGGGFRRLGKFTRVFLKPARRNVSAAHLKQTIRRNEIRQAIDEKNSRNACAVVNESYERAGDQHPA